MNILIHTQRLIIRPLTAADAPGMFAMDSDPAVHTYLGNKPVTSIDTIHEVIKSVRQQYTDNGIGRWAMINKETGEFIGWTGFKLMCTTLNGHTNYYDFGYRMAQKYWGMGLATEGGRAALHYGINQLRFKDIYAITDDGNAASRNVLQKLGFSFQHIFNFDDDTFPQFVGTPTTWYKLNV